MIIWSLSVTTVRWGVAMSKSLVPTSKENEMNR
jgi:hypothetical protein